MSDPADIRRRVSELRAQLDTGDADATLRQIEQAAHDDPNPPMLGLLGEAYLRLDRANDAVIPLAAATGLSDHSQYAIILARALLKIGRTDDGMLIAQRILRRDPRNRDALDIMQQLHGQRK